MIPYAALIYDKNKIRIINSITGAVITTISTGREIIGQPMVNADKLFVTVKNGASQRIIVYSLPSGQIHTSINS